MQVTLRGKGTSVNLTKQHFLAKGGEGEVYAKGTLVYKICEPGKMIPEGKITELAGLADPHIIKPEDILVNAKHEAVGYTMRRVENAACLCQLFTKAYRNRTGISPQQMLDLVRQMQTTIRSIHGQGILLVDLNELNFLVDESGHKDVWFIDVGSYQTPHYPATAIMDSVRDRHCQNNRFTEGTDWFSFAVVSFQMFIGIHPYKGKHPAYPDPKTAMDGRMLANLSVLNAAVTYPQSACQPLSAVPDVYLAWYRAVLEQGKRIAPPDSLVSAVVVAAKPQAVIASHSLSITELHDYGSDILDVAWVGGATIAITRDGVYSNMRKLSQGLQATGAGICITPRNEHPVAVSVDHGSVVMCDLATGRTMPITLDGHSTMTYDGRCYVVGCGKILEIKFTELGDKIFPAAKQVGSVLEQGVQVFDGVIIQNLFDAHYASVFPNSGEMWQVALRDLDGYKVSDAKFTRGVLQIVAVNGKTGQYDRLVYCFTGSDAYEHYIIRDIANVGLNFTVLDNGLCVQINEDEDLEIFSVSNPSKRKVIQDIAIEADMRLASRGAQVYFTRDSRLYSLSMTKGA